MKFFIFALALFFAPVAFGQKASDPAQPDKHETPAGPATGSTLDKFTPAMYPGAAAEDRAVAEVRSAAASIPPQVDARREWSSIEIVLTVSLLIFTLIVLGMVVFLARKALRPWSPQSIMRVFGITLIIPLGVMLVVAGYSEKQIASVVGLLGVIAGYLLGNGERSERPRDIQ